MTMKFINGPDDYEVGYIIGHSTGPYEFLIIEKDGNSLRTKHRFKGSNGEWSIIPMYWHHYSSFRSPYGIVGTENKMLKYDPNQQGDTYDDI